MHSKGTRTGSVQAVLLRKWNLDTHPANPRTWPLTPLVWYICERTQRKWPMCQNPRRTIKKIRTRLYRGLHTMASAATPARPCRVEMLHPSFDWHRIWRNQHAAWVPATVRSQWCMAIHDILPTKKLLHRISLDDTAQCTHCEQLDTLSHRLIECGTRKVVWRWTQGHMVTMLRTHPCRIPDDWPIRPRFSLWPSQRHGTVLWVLAYFVYYRVQYPTTPTLQDL